MAQEQRFSCPYCGTVIKATWQEGAKPVCPNCRAQLKELEIPISTTLPKERGKGVPGVFLGILVLAAVALISYFILTGNRTGGGEPPETEVQTENGYYVEEIGRNCRWVPAAESYFDPVSDCHFWYNDEIDYPAWQYYYGAISRDFGDYGWMEYREEEDVWYIEESEGHWIRLPEKYDTASLWHIN